MSVPDKDYLETARRIYEELGKIIIPNGANVVKSSLSNSPGKTGAWVDARVWVNDEWVNDED